jgi:hypothetical protein
MRRRFALGCVPTLVLLLSASAPAQDATSLLEPGGVDDPNETVLEHYLDERDRLIVERTRHMKPIPLGAGASLGLEAIVAFEPSRTQERMLGVRVRVAGSPLRGRAALAYLDLREVEELLRAIDLMDELLATEPEGSDVEVRHTTRDGFGVATARVAGQTTLSIRLDSGDDEEPTGFTVGNDAMATLRDQLDSCRSYLFQQ